MYFAEAKVNTITLLKPLGLSILYKVLLKKLCDITLISKVYIQKQANNAQLVCI